MDSRPADGRPLDERAPHKATRDVVDVDGATFVRVLYRWFDELNALYFAAELAPPLILVASTSSPRAIGDHCEKDVHGLRSVIRLHPKLSIERGPLFLKDVLMHEMVHVWQSEIAGDLEAGYRGHGPKFADKCNEIGAALGLAPVGLKGRKGLPDCAHWPEEVRPDGYYPPAPPKKTRAKKATAADVAGGGGEQGDGGDRDDAGDGAAFRKGVALCKRSASLVSDKYARVLRAAAGILADLAASADAQRRISERRGAP